MVWLDKVRFDRLGFVRLGKAVLHKADVSEKTIGLLLLYVLEWLYLAQRILNFF